MHALSVTSPSPTERSLPKNIILKSIFLLPAARLFRYNPILKFLDPQHNTPIPMDFGVL